MYMGIAAFLAPANAIERLQTNSICMDEHSPCNTDGVNDS